MLLKLNSGIEKSSAPENSATLIRSPPRGQRMGSRREHAHLRELSLPSLGSKYERSKHRGSCGGHDISDKKIDYE